MAHVGTVGNGDPIDVVVSDGHVHLSCGRSLNRLTAAEARRYARLLLEAAEQLDPS